MVKLFLFGYYPNARPEPTTIFRLVSVGSSARQQAKLKSAQRKVLLSKGAFLEPHTNQTAELLIGLSKAFGEQTKKKQPFLLLSYINVNELDSLLTNLPVESLNDTKRFTCTSFMRPCRSISC